MGNCKDCCYYSSGYCSITKKNSWSEKPASVSPYGSCSRFVGTGIISKSKSDYKDGGCFLTTARVHHLGLEDDCYELETLRNFRDNYLKSTDDGKELVSEYYSIAPGIVEKIDNSDNQNQYYDYIYAEIKKCISEIESGSNENAVAIYRKMVETLS